MGQAGDNAKNCGRSVRSVLLNHHFRCFDNGGDRIAFFKLEFIGTAAGYNALDEIVANPNNHMRHNITELNFFDLSTQFVSR